jgi:polyhydroxyalkanoate synthesis regulator phasin
MPDSLFDQLKSRGEAFLTDVSNRLMANPNFIEMVKKGIEAKEAIDRQVSETLKRMNVATRKDIRRLEDRIAALEAELAAARAKAEARPRAAAKKTTRTSRK